MLHFLLLLHLESVVAVRFPAKKKRRKKISTELEMSFDDLLGNNLCLAPPPCLVHSPGPVDQEEGEALDVTRGPHQKAVSRDSLKND